MNTYNITYFQPISASSQSSQDTLEAVNEEKSAEKKRDINIVSDTDVLTAVLLEGMIIKDGVFYGISEEWYESTFPQKEKIKVSLMITETVTIIANDAFQSNYTNAKNHSST